MQYIRDVNASEAFVVGQDSSMTASNKEASMKAFVQAWEAQVEDMVARKKVESKRMVNPNRSGD